MKRWSSVLHPRRAIAVRLCVAAVVLACALPNHALADEPPPPEPTAVTVSVSKPEPPPPPEPTAITISVCKPEPPPPPEPTAVTISVSKPEPPPPPEPTAVTISVSKPEPPPPPEPTAVIISVSKPDHCEQPKRDLAEARSLTDAGSLMVAEERLERIEVALCPELGPRIDAERRRISQTLSGLIAKAETALEACQLKEARQFIVDLPSGERRSELAGHWNRAIEDERRARAMIEKAMALRDRGDLAQAMEKLRQARELPPCPVTVTVIDELIGGIESRTTEAAAAEAETALNACEFKDSHRKIGALPEGPRRVALVERWNRAYATERMARDRIEKAVRLRDAGDPGRAIGELHAARNLGPCAATVTAIDQTISQLDSGLADANIAKAEAALDACNFQDSHQRIQDLPESARRIALVERWNRSYTAERKAHELVKAGMALKDRGEPEQAIRKLHQAQELTSCTATVAVIDKAVAAIERQRAAMEERAAQCRRIIGRWKWFTGNEADFFDDNRWQTTDGRHKGSWQCRTTGGAGVVFVVTPDQGTWEDTVAVASDGASLSGQNRQGVVVTATRMAPAARECPTGYNPFGCN